MTPLVRRMHKLTCGAVSPAMWFDMGEVDKYATDPATCPPLMMPFTSCAIVCRDGSHYRHLCWFVQAAPDVVTVVHRVMRASGWHGPPMFAVTITDSRFAAHQIDGEEMPTKDEAVRPVGLLQEWLTRLQTHACDAYEPVIRETFTNRRKAAEGKQPSYSWRTVVVPSMLRARAINGGTHASPRLHERRGHWRTIAGGRKVWVRDCLVGNPDLGVVEKDYKIRLGMPQNTNH
jgi:hypothetical protein